MSPYGIFGIETKNYKGWIYGRRHAEYWTQNIYGTKFPLRNPVRQNYAHTRALQGLLGIPLNRCVQIVVFLDRAELKGYMDERVVYLSQLREFILSHSTERLTTEEVASFRDLIHTSDVRGTKAAKRHILYVRARVQERQRLIESRICPRCGGQLLVRQGPYSTFLGCSNYPRSLHRLRLEPLISLRRKSCQRRLVYAGAYTHSPDTFLRRVSGLRVYEGGIVVTSP